MKKQILILMSVLILVISFSLVNVPKEITNQGQPFEDLQKQIDELKAKVAELEANIPANEFIDYSDKIAGTWQGVTAAMNFIPAPGNISRKFNSTFVFSQPDSNGIGTYTVLSGRDPFSPWESRQGEQYELFGDILLFSGYPAVFSIKFKIIGDEMRFEIDTSTSCDNNVSVGYYKKIAE